MGTKTTIEKKMGDRATLKKFNLQVFLDKLTKIHLTLDLMEDDALELPKLDMYEIYLVLCMMHEESKKLRKASGEMLSGGGLKDED